MLPWRANLTDENPNFLAFPDALALGDGTLYLGSESGRLYAFGR